jgi:16S rRNA (guanine527-N7)-methyltransferase
VKNGEGWRNVKLLFDGAQALGLTLTQKELEAFRVYQHELVEWNERFNLTAISDEKQVQVRHFLDSLSCLLVLDGYRPASHASVRRIPESVRTLSLRIIDVGTGPGFPGLALKIVCPRLKLTLLEATAKKVTFLQHMVDLLKLKDVQVVQERAEQAGQTLEHREVYDVVVARAVAELAVLAEYTLPLCRLGGWVIVQKGLDVQAEVMAAERAVNLLGGKVRQLVDVEVPGLAESRSLVILDKVARTPPNYPRRPGMPHKRPLF